MPYPVCERIHRIPHVYIIVSIQLMCIEVLRLYILMWKKIQTEYDSTHDVTNENQLKGIVIWYLQKWYSCQLMHTCIRRVTVSFIQHNWGPCRMLYMKVIYDIDWTMNIGTMNKRAYSGKIWVMLVYTQQKCISYQPQSRSVILSYWN